MNFIKIGSVESQFKTPTDPFLMRKHDSIIVIEDKFTDGLLLLEKNTYIQVFFHFHLNDGYNLQINNYYGHFKGVFATRSPNRPSGIGCTIVKLIKIEGNRLFVSGLDAIDQTPVLDLKPYVKTFDFPYEEEKLMNHPRYEINNLIHQGNLKKLLLLTGQIHGHYCPGVTIGVLASYLELKKKPENLSDGLEGIVAIVEVNSCFVDGIQFVAGCTLGNNGLIYRDIGKTAVTFVSRISGKGRRYLLNKPYFEKHNSHDQEHRSLFLKVVNEGQRDPDLIEKFKQSNTRKAFKILEGEIENYFEVSEIEMKIPDHSRLFDSFICEKCSESTMITRRNMKDSKALCPFCSNDFFEASGNGIKRIKKSHL